MTSIGLSTCSTTDSVAIEFVKLAADVLYALDFSSGTNLFFGNTFGVLISGLISGLASLMIGFGSCFN